MISEADVEKAIDWLRDNARPAAQAKAERIYMDEYRKTVEAQLMAEKPEETVSAQQVYARGHPAYIAHLQAMKTAVENDEAMRWLMVAAEAKVSAWQTQCRMQR